MALGNQGFGQFNLAVKWKRKIDFQAKAAEEFGKIQGELKRMGKPTGQLDALIASVARSRQERVNCETIRTG